MSAWRRTLHVVPRAAIRTHRLAGGGHVEKDTGMARPQRHRGVRTIQRQVCCRDFDSTLHWAYRAHRLWSDGGEPGSILGVLAVHGIEKQSLQLPGDRSALAGTDRAIVELTDRRHLGGGAGEE